MEVWLETAEKFMRSREFFSSFGRLYSSSVLYENGNEV